MPSINAAKKLTEEGISVTVVNARFIKPLDEDLITKLASETSLLVTVEEAALMGGFGSAVIELIESRSIPNCRVCRIGVPDRIISHGSPSLLHAKYGLDSDGIYQRIRSFVSKKDSEAPPSKWKNVVKATFNKKS